MKRGKLLLVAGLVLLAACGRERADVAEPAPVTPTIAPDETDAPADAESPTATESPEVTAVVYAAVVTPEPTESPTATSASRATTAPVPTRTPTPASPPPSFVRSKDGEQQGRLGSYCWHSRCRTVEPPHGRPKSGLLDMFTSEKSILRYAPDDIDPSQITVDFRQNSKTIATVTPRANNPTLFNTAPPPGRYWLVVSSNWTQGRTTHVFAVNVFEKATPAPD